MPQPKFNKLIKYLLTLMICILFQSVRSAYAQFPRFLTAKIQYDTSFLDRAPSKWSIRLYSISKYQQFRMYSRATNAALRYAPNKFYAVGGGFSYNRLNLDLAFYSFANKPQDDVGDKSKTFDFIGSLYAGQHLFEIFLQQSDGMFGKLSKNADVTTTINDTVIGFRQDISAFNLGVDYNYLFNSNKLTFSSLIGTEVQKKSAGGPLVGVFFSSYNLHADSSIVPADYAAVFEDHGELTDINTFNIGLSGGYVYTFVFPFHFFLTLSLAPGFSFSRSEVKANNDWYVAGDPVKLSFKLITRGAAGYNGKRVYGVLSMVNDQSLININNKNQFQQDLGKLKLVFGYRFN